MLTTDEILAPVVSWCQSITGLTCVIEPNNDPQAPRPYCSIYLKDELTIGQDYTRSASGKTYLCGTRDFVVELSCYGNFIVNPMDTLRLLRATMYTEEVVRYFGNNGIVQLDVNDSIKDTTYDDLEENHWVPRATTEITFRTNFTHELLHYEIITTTINGTLKNGLLGNKTFETVIE